MSYSLLTEYAAECACSPDGNLCWKVFGKRPVGSTGAFTFPVNLEVNGEVIQFTNPNQIIPGGSNPTITDWTDGPFQYAFIYTSQCPSDNGCSDAAFFLVEADSCCNGVVTISELDCDFSSVIAGISSPSYQWQILSAGIWTNIAGATSSSYSGEDGETYRLVVTDGVNGCIYISQPATGDCPGLPCSISCNMSYNAATGQIVVNYNISGDPPFNYQINGFVNDNPSNCLLSSGVESAICSGSLSTGVGQITCTPPASAADECYRVVIFGDGCQCQDTVVVPGQASCEVSISQQMVSCVATIGGPYNSGGTPGSANFVALQNNTVWQELDWYYDGSLCGDAIPLTLDPDSYSVGGPNQNTQRSWRANCGYELLGSDGITGPGVVGDYMSSIQLSNNLGSSITINTDPNTCPPAYLQGVNVPDLYYIGSGGSTQNTATRVAYTTLLQNAISIEFGATMGNNQGSGDYWMDITARQDVFANRWLIIRFLVKHNASGLWVGPALGQIATCSNANGDSSIDTLGSGVHESSFPAGNIISSFDSPCGIVYSDRYQMVGIDDIDYTATDYNTITLLDAVVDYSFLLTPESNSPLSCTAFELTANASGSGTPSYLWSTGETTQTISVTSGTYFVIVTYPDGCETQAQITV